MALMLPTSVKAEPLSSHSEQTPAPRSDDVLLISDDEDDNSLCGDNADQSHYKEEFEALPKAPAFDPEFQEVIAKLSTVIGDAIEAIPEESRQNAEFQHLVEKAEQYKALAMMRKRKINIVGRSGSGKSSLLNSVLGQKNAAKALAGSVGCTHIPTSYETPFPGQTKRFGVKIEFFSKDEIHSKISLMLKDWYARTNVSEEDLSDLDQKELAEIEAAANTAMETFRSLFCSGPQFATETAGKEFLENYNNDFNAIVDTLTRWCLELLFGEDDEVREEEEEFSNFYEDEEHENLIAYVEPYAFSSLKFKKSELWPLVKTIRQGFANINVLKYATLTDWPGSDDTNQLRANASADRIYHCDEIWIVSSADRIITDPTATKNLVRYGKDMDCVLICTGIDDKWDDDGLAAEMEKYGHDMGNYLDLSDEAHSLEKKIPALRKQRDKILPILKNGWVLMANNKRKMLSDRKIEIYKEYLQEYEDLSARLERCKQEQFELIISVRKRYIGQLAQRQLSSYVREENINFLAVSNTHYLANKGARAIAGPQLSPEATGVPAVRRHIFESAAPDILKSLKMFVDHEIKAFLEGVKIIINPQDIQEYEEALEKVHSKKDHMHPFTEKYLKAIETIIDDELTSPLKERHNEFADAAIAVLETKKRWAWSTIRAFVRNGGSHATTKISWECWNEQFMQEAATEIQDLWPNLVSYEQDFFSALQKHLVDHCMEIAVDLDQDAIGYRIGASNFAAFMRSQVKGVEQLCDGYRKDFSESLKNIKIESTQADDQSPTSFFNLAMDPSWEYAATISGPGSKLRTLAVFDTRFHLNDNGSPFVVLRNEIAAAIVAAVKKHLETVVAGVGTKLEDTREWLQAAFYRQTSMNAEGEKAVENLQKYHIRAQDEYECVLLQLISIEDRYKMV